MKYIIIIILVGISEIILIGELHDLIGLKEMLLVYISTTIVGACILYLYSSKAKRAMKLSKKIGKKLQKKTKKSSYIPTHDELEKLQPSVYVGIYIIAIALVAIPGILTDLIGMIIVIPFINKWLINREINKYIINSDGKNA